MLALTFGVAACNSSDTPSGATATTEANRGAPNILVLIADDAGVEQFASFGIGSAPASTPNLDALAARGMQFSTVWAQPMCSPTRATLLAGRYAFRTGVGFATAGMGVGGDYPEPPEPLAGASLPDDRPLDSVSLAPYFANPVRESIRTYQLAEFFHSAYGARAGEYAIGDGDHKLIGRRDGRELYDLGADLSESKDLLADGISAAEREIVNRLEATVEELRRSE